MKEKKKLVLRIELNQEIFNDLVKLSYDKFHTLDLNKTTEYLLTYTLQFRKP